ncbi:LamG-like jellyroll fold domain-containing protein [Flavobacterium sp. Arc2]|uniref:LamG-like jellyroll fold domain-containing protein n=1 Tax=Flavobacterium sp. Arc2 TaxID=3046685 RepID=UPI00352ED3C1
MENFTFKHHSFLLLILVIPFFKFYAQTVTSPQVNFTQRTSTATPAKKIYNVKGDFTMLGNTNLTLATYGDNIDNQNNYMKFVDTDNDPTTFNSSKATLELSNTGENSSNQNCSTVLFAALYWTGKSDDADIFTTTKQKQTGTKSVNANSSVSHNQNIQDSNYSLSISSGSNGNSRFPFYTFRANNITYQFAYYTDFNIYVSVNNGNFTLIPSSTTYSGGYAYGTLNTPYVIQDGAANLSIKQLVRKSNGSLNTTEIQNSSTASVNMSGTVPIYTTESKTFNKKVISLKGPGASTYTSITAKTTGTSSNLLFPGTSNSGIFVGYQEVTDYVKTHGPGAYTVADIALSEIGSEYDSPGFSGGWTMIVIYENPVMKSRAVTLFDGYANVNSNEYGNISISGFTTAGSGNVNMKLGVMAAEGDIGISGDYLAVQKLNLPTNSYPSSYSILTHDGNTTNNFFNSSIFPVPAAGKSDPILKNNSGVDFSMFTIPNSNNSVIGNNQTSTNFRYGSSGDVYTIFGFAMSVDAYIPEPNGLISVNSINNNTNPTVLNALPGQKINYSLSITNEGTEATNNTIIEIPIPATAIFNTAAAITYNTYNGFSTAEPPRFDSAANKIIWKLGTLPIAAGHPEYVYADISFELNVTNDCSIIINAGCNPVVSLETGTISGNGATSGSPFTRYFFQGYDSTSCHLPIEGSIKVAINGTSCVAVLAGVDASPSCGLQSVKLAATSSTSGKWSIVNGPSGGTFSNQTSTNSEFYSPNSGVYTLRWTVTTNNSCPPITDDVQISIGLCNKLDFDGIDDNVNFNNNFNLNSGSFTIETWIKPGAVSTDIQTIFSKRNTLVSNEGYDLRLVNNIISFNWNNSNNSNSIKSNYPVSTGRWHHVAVTFDGTSYKLYIDGVSVQSPVAGSNPIINNNTNCILGAMMQAPTYPYLPVNFFKGWMQELRIWKVALTEAQTHQMMNQKIKNNSTNVYGEVVPLAIQGLSWENLDGYFQMTQSSDIVDGLLMDKTSNLHNGRLIGIITAQPETAPLPYTSSIDGAWEANSSWTYGDVWNIPNTLGVDNTTFIDWNIVKTVNNITTIGNKQVLGLLVGSNTLGANNDNKIEISHYLKLDGKIDLVSKSQLIQTEGSILDINSSGSIERDQQGQSNKYNYNYWSSPVSTINTTVNNKDYTVGGIMKDGTNSTPVDINWIGGYDGSPTTPKISLARYWLFKFDNYSNAYANWLAIGETGTVRVGQGFTLKGSGATTALQNYTFVGKPNNGLINSNTVSQNQLLLAGNPYPSALDSEAFIKDNLSVVNSNTNDAINGTLYLWEHYSTNNTHVLKDYQGGYAVLNLTGSTAPSSANVDFISKAGVPSRGIPNRFIPVGQAFFISGRPNSTNSTVIFKNSQRAFVKENEVKDSNVLYKIQETKKVAWKNNNSDIIPENTIKRIRLGFNSHNDYHKQLLLGFMNEKATDAIDYGYDATSFDNLPNDIYFSTNGWKLIIQGVGYFDAAASYPIGVKTDAAGKVQFLIDEIENFDTNQDIYIYDNETDTYHNIRDKLYEVVLPQGENKTRFSLRFTDKKLAVKDVDILSETDILISHQKNNNTLTIHNRSLDTYINDITLFNILGQSITSWNIENLNQKDLPLSLKRLSTGVYIAKINTSKGQFSKKIIIQ